MDYIRNPGEIEKKSLDYIREHLGSRSWAEPGAREIVMRVVHTAADLELADSVIISPGAVKAGIDAIQSGMNIVTDTFMARAGISESLLAVWGNKTVCNMRRKDVARTAEREGVTRAMISMRKAAREPKNGVYAIGNAPTALFAMAEMIEAGAVKPALIIGVPVGFVGAAESKERIQASGVPTIILRGNKGGSNIAAAVVNALLRLAKDGPAYD